MTRLALAAALVLAGCGEDAPDAPDPATEAPEAPEPGALRPPSGEAEVDCAGPPDDPDQITLFTQAAHGGELDRSIAGLEGLANAHPASSTARVRLGELLLRTQPPRAAEAYAWFRRARSLHDRGCELGYRDLWAAYEGEGLSLMMQGRYGDALAPLRESLRRWPGSRSTHYNVACALCQTDDLDGCERELGATLGELETPSFLASQSRPPSYYRGLIQRDPDLAPLRADAARLARVLGE